MAENKVVAELRDSFGKGAARKLRAVGKVPAVIYGHGTDPRHVTLPGHEMMLIMRKANAVLELDIDGTPQLALVKDVQKDPVRQIIEHIDLIVIRQGERVAVDVPVHVEGESAPETISNLDQTSISIEVDAIRIPENVVVSVEGLEEGAHIVAGDVALPDGATLLTDPETLVVSVSVPQLDLTTDAVDEPAEGDEGVEIEGEGGTSDETVDADSGESTSE
ncbi:50S ribosomal protein L25/general stress protein Ctc [Planctomonas psychrotolerans]|uniref:50S ribosomal protein L25/general stress protein Ctc n=1 Tax=Planctomonas psychrotolerans TaxID=2528712 RepID=UPI0012386401|nr:50S ribosomal protein L25/general stress protein Ctc [Planctomonas psychrotolerans]